MDDLIPIGQVIKQIIEGLQNVPRCQCGHSILDSDNVKLVPPNHLGENRLMWTCPEPCGSTHLAPEGREK